MRYLVILWAFLSGLWAQRLRSREKCTGPSCSEKVKVEEEKPRRRSLRRSEARVDRFGYPKRPRRYERFRMEVYSPRHKPIHRQEAFSPYQPSVRHRQRAERFNLAQRRSSRRSLARAEKQGLAQVGRIRHRQRAERFTLVQPRLNRRSLSRAEQQDVAIVGRLRHRQRAEKFSLTFPRPSGRSLSKAEQQNLAQGGKQRHRQRAEQFTLAQRRLSRRSLSQAEKQQFSEKRTHHPHRAEELSLALPTPTQRSLRRAERLIPPVPAPRHLPRAEYYRPKELNPRHKRTPEGNIYTPQRIKRRRPSQSGCEPPPIPHNDYAEQLSCEPRPMRRINFDKYTCQTPSVRHRLPRSYEGQNCAPPPISHKNFDRYACQEVRVKHLPPRAYEYQACMPPPIPHKNFDRFTCYAPQIDHRLPKNYDVPCDAQRRGVMTATERFAHDLRYIFTNHKKHCEVASAYSGVSIGEWVNTESYGRVPVAGYVMGYRTYVFAHFYDKEGRPLKKPRLERRKVWALKQIEVWVVDSTHEGKGKRRYIKGLPGVEGFGGVGGGILVRKRLSIQETRAIQIEKLIRKRQIAWLVRAYPEERVRLHEWLKKYAGPKPEHFWPGVDYRLLEIW